MPSPRFQPGNKLAQGIGAGRKPKEAVRAKARDAFDEGIDKALAYMRSNEVSAKGWLAAWETCARYGGLAQVDVTSQDQGVSLLAVMSDETLAWIEQAAPAMPNVLERIEHGESIESLKAELAGGRPELN